METGYQRGKIQEESLYYETLKHDGSCRSSASTRSSTRTATRSRAAGADALDGRREAVAAEAPRGLPAAHAPEAPALLAKLRQAVIDNGNVFEALMEAVRGCSLGQITQALFEVGGQYRRSM